MPVRLIRWENQEKFPVVSRGTGKLPAETRSQMTASTAKKPFLVRVLRTRRGRN
jgi:hypothetical protein